MAEEEADASYSDGEFGSERADSEDYEEFEQDEDAVHGSFDQEPKEEVAAEEVAAETEVEDYDGDFDEDEAVQKEKTASKQSSEASTGTSQDSALSVEASFNSDVLVVAPDQSDEIRNSAAETVQDEAVEPSVVAHKAQEKAISRRASLPAGMSEDPPPRKPFLHSGSMPTIRLERPLDKWMDTIPKELSPEKPGRIKIARLPVLQEPNSDDDGETNVDNAGNCDDDDSDDACAARQTMTYFREEILRRITQRATTIALGNIHLMETKTNFTSLQTSQ
ncbi:hypothetical protein PHYBOEH_004930 [Phytophthora boehmeriae]|uniref:Uncharacterized protein n=1 Tax=Phytophthora boehmeriae TaxID=109152 RepID=A0A8T1X4U4_9STRA|nr:hypothetical protein PHYBOEH_004930 [Phytophthora boehmeriae]